MNIEAYYNDRLEAVYVRDFKNLELLMTDSDYVLCFFDDDDSDGIQIDVPVDFFDNFLEKGYKLKFANFDTEKEEYTK